MHANSEYVRRALQAGAAGYLLKNARAAELELALTAVAQGAIYLSPAVADIVTADLGGQDAPEVGWQPKLTPREHAVVRLVAKGCPNKAIATQLSISVRTVERHRSAIMRKLGLRHQAELVSYAVRHGLLEPGSGIP
jgi:DNA-binding NarL/FixJ family response regulator